MKITKLMCMVLTAVLLASCGATKADSQEKYREISAFANICFTDSVAGEFYLDENDAQHFVDYNTLVDVLVCARPNCPHKSNYSHEEAECSAYGLGEKPCLYGNKLYYMTNEIKMKDSSPVLSISLSCCDIDGTNRKKIAELEGYWSCGIMDYLVGDKLYFVAAYEEFNRYVEFEGENSGKAQYSESGIWCYNFSENKFELIYDNYNGNYNSIGLNGYWKDRLYFSCSEVDQKSVLTGGRYVIDLASGDVTEAESEFVAVSGEYLITLENGTLVLHKDDETQIVAEGFDYGSGSSLSIVNGKLFSTKNDYCFDIETGKCRKVSLPKNTEVRSYIDGYYIIYGYDFEKQKPIYAKVSESELIGAEIK